MSKSLVNESLWRRVDGEAEADDVLLGLERMTDAAGPRLDATQEPTNIKEDQPFGHLTLILSFFVLQPPAIAVDNELASRIDGLLLDSPLILLRQLVSSSWLHTIWMSARLP